MGASSFLDAQNLADILTQISEIGIIAVAMTFVILTGGIDLSVGSTLALSATIVALVLTKVGTSLGYPAHIALAICIALGTAAVVGLLNGAIISRLAIQPFIVTLAAMIGLRGFTRWISGNQNIDFSFHGDVTAAFSDAISSRVVIIGCFIGLSAIFVILLTQTVFGRYVRAIGDNPTAARYAGLPVVSTKIRVYFLCGLLSGVAGVLHAAHVHQGNPNDGVAYELDAIAAVVIGGTSLAGGQGSILGTIIGTLIMGVLTNILRLKMVDSNVELMIKAIIIVAAVWAQSRRKRI